MSQKIDLVQLYERNIKIEQLLNSKLKQFNQELEFKEKEIQRLNNLINQKNNNKNKQRINYQNMEEKNKNLGKSIKTIKSKVEKIYQKIDESNEQLDNLIGYIASKKQVGGGEEEIINILNNMESNVKKNINRVNFIRREIENFLDEKNVDIEDLSKTINQIVEEPNVKLEIDYENQAKKIVNEIETKTKVF
jgi:hypothetical protein